jgi:hypothetical protein
VNNKEVDNKEVDNNEVGNKLSQSSNNKMSDMDKDFN